ncbi:hypothetical protein [Cupriavidus nantongensis]|uniref:Uncharacterized protein n=1 Tax=Cupriavidus nantongensis TaxID=1796606 RepID=A0A142JIU4_9BURK|nr:hypothetical protein [Cupriavidus nantongensis]AMR78006.1 hypothetical protein A2G96_09775 [Cupriavidus nantongensis]
MTTQTQRPDAATLLASLRTQAATHVFTEPDDKAYAAAYEIGGDDVAQRILIERAIIRLAVQDLIGAGYAITIDDGKDTPVKSATQWERVMPHIGHCDEEWINVMERREESENDVTAPQWSRVGSIYLVYATNGCDVICNYTSDLERPLSGANDLAMALREML